MRRKFCPAIQFPGFIWEIHRASPRPSPTSLKITAILAVQSKSLSRMQRCPNITKNNSSQSNSECLLFFYLLRSCLAFIMCAFLYLEPPIHPTLVVLPQLPLTHNIHILPFQHPEAANSSITWTTIQHSFCCRREHYKQPKVLAEHARCLWYVGPSETTIFHRSKWFAK